MLIDKNLLLANLRKNCIEDKLDLESAAWVIKIIKDTPEAKGLEAICDLAYSLSPEHRKIKNKVDTYDMLDGMTFDQIKAYVWEYEKLMDKIFDLINEEGEAVENMPPVKPVHRDRTVQDFADRCRECGSRYGRMLKQSRWIPVSERLPEESLNSIIGWDTCRERCVFVQFIDGHFQITGKNESFDIQAWMPLPNPYKTESEVKE